MNNQRKQSIRARIILVGVCFALVFSALLLRAAHLQVLQGEELSARAAREFKREIDFPPRRGVILDRNMDELAVSLDTDSIYARPLQVADTKEASVRLAVALEEDQLKIADALDTSKRFIWLARRVNPAIAKAVRALELKGVGITVEPKRFYPYSSLACHVLGFAGTDAKGLEGLEMRYNSELTGSNRTTASLRDALGRTVHLNPDEFADLPEGNHLVLTIDKHLQYQAEKILAATVEKFKARGAQAVVMVPQTGEILAMVSLPSFNPNVFGSYHPSTYRNRVVTDAFEPGSTFKMFVVAAALNQGVIPRTQKFFCENGLWQVAGRRIRDTHEYGDLTMAEIIKYSSNIGAAKLGQMVGADTLNQTFRSFGFGQNTEIDLPGESRGILRDLRANRPVDLANTCFGQGLAVTGIQLTTAVAAIANNGLLMRPYLVKAIMDPKAQLLSEAEPTVVNRVMEPGVARLLTAMLCMVTEPGGTAARLNINGVRIAGKTGTAQKAVAGGYSHDDYIASFVGFLPADNPKLVILVLIDSPKGSHFGSTVAGPAWVEIAKAGLERIGASPSLQQAALTAPAANVAAPYIAPDPEPALESGYMPDLRGLSLRQVLNVANSHGIEIKASGFGRVVMQSPMAGALLPQGGGWEIKLAPAEGGV